MTIPEPGTGRRRTMTSDELRIWRRFLETSEQLRNVVTGRLQDESGLSSGDYGVLLALSEQPEKRMRSSRLADHIGWERSRLSHHLGRMERRGLVEREPVAGDSRGAVVALTTDGAQLFRAASAPHLRVIHETFVRALSAEQLAALDDAMTALAAHLPAR